MDDDKKLQIAILLYPGVTALDAIGPYEVFSRMHNADVRFVGKEIGPVTTEGDALLLGVAYTQARAEDRVETVRRSRSHGEVAAAPVQIPPPRFSL